MKFLFKLVTLVVIFFICSWPVFAAEPVWQFQSIDTMKYSRDLAREKLTDKNFDSVIDEQIQLIAESGATHVAIGTPYDQEFIPFLQRWVKAARKYDLNVWFRGNFSGWEEWFGYKKIDRKTHLAMTKTFITDNKNLFEDGDIFSPCPECENGGPGDPRSTHDVTGHRNFLIQEHKVATESFRKIHKDVNTSFNSMNGDVARLVMDKETTKALGGVVVIDHYVKNPEDLASDVQQIVKESGGQVVLGEFGAPIPDIHGQMSQDDQNTWLVTALQKLSFLPGFMGMNYWTSVGSSTQLWNEDLQPTKAARTLQDFYKGHIIQGVVLDGAGKPIKSVKVIAAGRTVLTDDSGAFSLPYLPVGTVVKAEKGGYSTRSVKIHKMSPFVSIRLTDRQDTWYTKIIQKIQELSDIKISFTM